MEITEVRVRLKEEDKLKAFINITMDNAIAVRGLKVIDGEKGLFVSMPSRRRKDGKYEDVFHPINNETRQMMEKVILERYEEELNAVVETEEVDEYDEVGEEAVG